MGTDSKIRKRKKKDVADAGAKAGSRATKQTSWQATWGDAGNRGWTSRLGEHSRRETLQPGQNAMGSGFMSGALGGTL